MIISNDAYTDNFVLNTNLLDFRRKRNLQWHFLAATQILDNEFEQI